MEEACPELILLGNTRIVKPHIFNIASHGCLNFHPGILPWIKGSFPVVWAILKDIPVGSTVHFINEGIDTGEIISQKEVSRDPDDTIESLIEVSDSSNDFFSNQFFKFLDMIHKKYNTNIDLYCFY